MKRPISITLFIFFTAWATFKAFESLLRAVGGSQETYAYHNLEWLYYTIAIFTGIAGLVLIYGLWKSKPWVYLFGTIWLIVGIAHTVFIGAISYLNKPLMIQIMTSSLERRGRDTTDVVAYINSTVSDIIVIGTSAILVTVMVVFIWKLWQHKIHMTS